LHIAALPCDQDAWQRQTDLQQKQGEKRRPSTAYIVQFLAQGTWTTSESPRRPGLMGQLVVGALDLVVWHTLRLLTGRARTKSRLACRQTAHWHHIPQVVQYYPMHHFWLTARRSRGELEFNWRKCDSRARHHAWKRRRIGKLQLARSLGIQTQVPCEARMPKKPGMSTTDPHRINCCQRPRLVENSNK